MQFDHAVILVSDLDASLPWYAAVLAAVGFDKSRDHVWINEAHQALELRQAEDLDQTYRRGGVGLNHFAVRAESHAALDAVALAVARAGFEVPAFQDFGGERALFLKDRDGMRIEVVSYGG